MLNYLFHSSKETFLQHFRQFLENWIFDGKSTGATLQNSELFVLSQNGVRKYFLAKLFVPLIKRNLSTTFKAVFGKLTFLTENPKARTLQNNENFVLSQNGVRKYFLAKLFVPLIKRNLSTTFEAVFGKLNFWRKIDRRGPFKIVNFLYYLKME